MERATALAATCGWLTFASGGAEAVVGVTIGAVGLAAVLSDAVRNHGPESERALKAIRQRIAKDLGVYAKKERWDNSADLAAADVAMERALAGCFLDRQALAASARNPGGFPDVATTLIVGKLAEREPEMFGAAGPSAARDYANLVVKTALKAAIENEAYFKNLQPHLVMETLRGIGSLEELVKEIKEKLDVLVAAQEAGVEPSARGLALSDLQELAERFGATEETTKIGLTAFLVQKAREYKSFTEQIDSIDDRIAGLGNLKAAAQDAADKLNFEEVENLLARVDEVETEIAAKTKELRATNALLCGKVSEAFKHFSAAADAFANVDQIELARRHAEYGGLLSKHGNRYGEGLKLSCEMFSVAMRVYAEEEHPLESVLIQRRLAMSLNNLGERVSGEAGNQLLGESIAAYRAVLQVLSKKDYPDDWATTQNNLGVALRNKGTRTAGDPSNQLLGEAVLAFRAALEAGFEQDLPIFWAKIQNNLSTALGSQGLRTDGEAGDQLLGDAVTACRATLQVYTEQDYPVDWAWAQINLASGLLCQGDRIGGEVGAQLLEGSVKACLAALRIYTEKDYPVNWARTQTYLAEAHYNISTNQGSDNPVAHLNSALNYIEAALTVLTPDTMSYHHQFAREFRELIVAEMDQLNSD